MHALTDPDIFFEMGYIFLFIFLLALFFARIKFESWGGQAEPTPAKAAVHIDWSRQAQGFGQQNLAPGINAQPLDMSLPTEEQEEALASSRRYSPQELAKRTGLSVSFAAVSQAQEVV